MPDVPVWPACDAACVFCSNPEGAYRRPKAEHALPAFVRRLALYKAGLERFAKFNEARDAVTLTGGEPTLHPRFLALAGAVRRQFPAALVRLLTHGRRFAERAFAARALAALGAPCEVSVNLTGPREGLARGVAGLRNLLALRGRGQRVTLRTVLTLPALESLGALAELARRRLPGLDAWALLFPELEGRAAREPEVSGLRIRPTAAALHALAPRLARAAPLELYHFPLCVLGEGLRPFSRSTLDPAKVVFALPCRACALRPGCVGIHKSYARTAGIAEFRAEGGA